MIVRDFLSHLSEADYSGQHSLDARRSEYNVPVYDAAAKVIRNLQALPEPEPVTPEQYRSQGRALIAQAPARLRDSVLSWLQLPKSDPQKQSVILAILGAVLARVGASTSYAVGLTPYEQAIFFETMFPFAMGITIGKLNGQSWRESFRAGLQGAATGAAITAGTGIVAEDQAVYGHDREELDGILTELCEMVLEGQEQDPDYYGMVGACVIAPDGQRFYSTSESEDGKWKHAERAALEDCGDVTTDCVLVTTLSPCNRAMPDRYGKSCSDLLDSYGITKVYSGYRDPSQDSDDSIVTENKKIRTLCKKLADTFLKTHLSEAGPFVTKQQVINYFVSQGRTAAQGAAAWDRGWRGHAVKVTKPKVKPYDPNKYKNYYWNKDLDEGIPDTIRELEDNIARLDHAIANMAEFKRPEDRNHFYMLKNLRRKAKKKLEQLLGQPASTDITENFADGRVKGKSRPGRVARAGASCAGSVTSLRQKARQGGEKGKMYHWCANMKAGRKK